MTKYRVTIIETNRNKRHGSTYLQIEAASHGEAVAEASIKTEEMAGYPVWPTLHKFPEENNKAVRKMMMFYDDIADETPCFVAHFTPL